MQRTTVAIVGKPNVGKSTLFNRLIGKHAAITQNLPGVTRDRIYGTCHWLDNTFALIDTGGLVPDPQEDPMLTYMQMQTRLAIEEADVIVCMFDGRAALTSVDYDVVNLLRQSGKPVLYVANKMDAPQHEDEMYHLYQLGVAEFILISAEHKRGLDLLLDAICEHVLPSEAEETHDSAMRIAVVGRPNVGKSSFINYVLNEDRLLVTDIAGTTRDSIDTEITRNGKRYVFIDTAGIRRKSKIVNPVERYSVIRAFKSMDRCHIAYVMLDAESGVTDQDARIAGYAHENGRCVLLVVNKWDLIEKDSRTTGDYVYRIKDKLKYLDYAPILFISVLQGQRVWKTLDVSDTMFEQYNTRVPTSKVNEALEQMLHKHHPPVYRGKQVKFYYGTQVAVRPPTVVLFCNYPDGVHFSYKRYLSNQFREYLHFTNGPLRLRIQAR